MPKGARKLSELLEQREQWKLEVGKTFSVARRASGQTQSQFAAELKISQAYVSQIEAGVRTPSEDTIRRLQRITEGASDGEDSK